MGEWWAVLKALHLVELSVYRTAQRSAVMMAAPRERQSVLPRAAYWVGQRACHWGIEMGRHLAVRLAAPMEQQWVEMKGA